MQNQGGSELVVGLSQARARCGLGRMLGGLAALGAVSAALGGDEAAGK